MAIDVQPKNFYMNVHQDTGFPINGYFLAVQKELERMGGFQFEYYPVPRPAINESIDEHLTKILPHVDLYGSAWYGATLEKRLLGMNFLEVLVQADGVLVTFHVPRAETSLLWSLFSPFTLEVWIFIVLVIVINAVFYWLVENPVTKDGSRISSLFYSLYLSMGVFLCIESMEPKKIPTRILNAVYSFFKLIILTLYTGKLADILIASLSGSVVYG